jgi:hypothetical protein
MLPNEGLAAYPGYNIYYNAATSLVGDLAPTTAAAYHIIEVALSECFSAPLPKGLLNEGLGHFTVKDIPKLYRPDQRFERLWELLPPLVPDLLSRVEKLLQDRPTGHDPRPSGHGKMRDLDSDLDLAEGFADLFKHELRRLLRQHDIPVLSSVESELNIVNVIREALRHDYPNSPDVLVATRKTERGLEERIAEGITLGETFLFRPKPKRLVLESDAPTWIESPGIREVNSHVALVATPARIQMQYSVEPSDWWTKEPDRPVVIILALVNEKRRLSGLLTRDLASLEMVLRRLPPVTLVVLIMASTWPDDIWWDTWGELLWKHGDVVLYGDTNLIAALSQLQREGHTITYAPFAIEGNDLLGGIVFDADLGFPLLWLGSRVACGLVMSLLRTTWEPTCRADPSLVREAVRVASSYIVNYESRTGLFQGSRRTKFNPSPEC